MIFLSYQIKIQYPNAIQHNSVIALAQYDVCNIEVPLKSVS